MPFQLSPGVLVVEKDLTLGVPAVSTSIGGYVGEFQWGPALEIMTISSEANLLRYFGKPNDSFFLSFFSAANFLAYSNNLKVVRVVEADARNATADGAGVVVSNQLDWEDNHSLGQSAVGAFAAKYPGLLGNGLRVSMADSATFSKELTGTITTLASITGTITTSLTSETVTGAGTLFLSETFVGARLYSGSTYLGIVLSIESNLALTLTGFAEAIEIGGPCKTTSTTLSGGSSQFVNETHIGAKVYTSAGVLVGTVLSIGGTTAITLTAPAFTGVTAAAGATASWVFAEFFDGAPGTSSYVERFGGSLDELHIVVEDHDGLFTGTPGTILEQFVGVSKASDAKTHDGAVNYYRDVLATSDYAWWMDHPTNVTGSAAWGSTASSTFKTLIGAESRKLSGGLDGAVATAGTIEEGYDMFLNTEEVDVSILINGEHTLAVGKYVIENIAQVRMDCVVTVSPALASVYNNRGSEADAIVAERVAASFNVNSSYGIMDSGWKYQYDKYNDVYRWIPLNADVAGLMARTDNTNDPWWSPGGLTRGQIKNVTKLAWNPDKADRDNLYKISINPVISTRGSGTVLFGDKTLLTKPSAFDRINVRRLFIVLEKAIAVAGQYQLFEFNDAFTRAQFRNLVEPYLRDVKARRGVYDFKVVCDDTNNTPEVIDRNEFVADIYIKPARSINFVTLNFIATRTGVSFSEVVGA